SYSASLAERRLPERELPPHVEEAIAARAGHELVAAADLADLVGARLDEAALAVLVGELRDRRVGDALVDPVVERELRRVDLAARFAALGLEAGDLLADAGLLLGDALVRLLQLALLLLQARLAAGGAGLALLLRLVAEQDPGLDVAQLVLARGDRLE